MPTTFQLVNEIKAIVLEIKCLLQDIANIEEDEDSLTESDGEPIEEEELQRKRSIVL